MRYLHDVTENQKKKSSFVTFKTLFLYKLIDNRGKYYISIMKMHIIHMRNENQTIHQTYHSTM